MLLQMEQVMTAAVDFAGFKKRMRQEDAAG
jgi:hypothetical protein